MQMEKIKINIITIWDMENQVKVLTNAITKNKCKMRI